MSSVSLVIKILLISGLMFLAGNKFAAAQDFSSLSGIVVDQNGALIPGVEITILSTDGILERTVLSDTEGFFTFPLLPFGEYNLKISKEGFDPSEIPDLTIETARQIKIELKITPLAEAVKVQSESVQTVENSGNPSNFDRALIDNLPLNGRNQQSLISLVPGVVLTPVDNRNLGQFSSNGQRTNSNFFTVDGVPANFGTTNYDFLGQTGSGSIPAMNVQGGLDNLISTEALREVRIQTLDFSPADGKTPGATVAFVSRSGGDDFSFSVFENFRSGALNAKDYFDIEKPPHIFNNFGGSFGGPLFPFSREQNQNNRTFFFASFEGRRFTLPQPTVAAAVPSRALRQETRNPVAQAIFNSFPLPNEKDDQSTSAAIQSGSTKNDSSTNAFFTETEEFRATYSDPNGAENYNLRVDHVFNSRFSVFGRFNYSPSFSENRNPANLSSLTESDQTTGTFTLGATQVFSGKFVNEFRFNSSFQTGTTNHDFDGLYGGILPDKSIFIPAAFDAEKTHFRFALNGFPAPLVFFYGNFAQNETRQLSFTDNLTYSIGSHEIRLGFDYRRLSPTLRASGYGINYDFNSADAVSLGTANRVSFYENPNVRTNVLWISSYVQDNWKIAPRFDLTYGVRWEINPAPSAAEEPALLTLEKAPVLADPDQSGLRLAPAGTPYYQTGLRNFAPRFGAAIQIFSRRDKQLILRGGIGTFYDLGQSQFNEIASPFEHTNGFAENLTLPVSNVPFDFFSNAASANNRLAVVSAAPDYRLPRTYFWTIAAQLKIGSSQMFSAAYVGGAGRKLQRTLTLNLAKPGKDTGGYYSDDFSKIIYIDNAYSSDYHAFQFQYSRTLANGLRAFSNYTWSHSIDNNSSDSNISTPFLNYPVSNDRGNSDFDLRHALNIGFTYNLPAIETVNPLRLLLKNWTFSGIFVARSGLPFDVKIAEFDPRSNDFYLRRAALTDGSLLYIDAPGSPTGVRLNPEAFTKPAGQFTQGNLGRNAFTGSSMWQFDASLGKKTKLTRRLAVELRTEVYNVFNRPNFSNPDTKILYQADEKIVPKSFGVPTKTMARGFASAEPTGGVSPIFQRGGARALQFNVRISF